MIIEGIQDVNWISELCYRCPERDLVSDDHSFYRVIIYWSLQIKKTDFPSFKTELNDVINTVIGNASCPKPITKALATYTVLVRLEIDDAGVYNGLPISQYSYTIWIDPISDAATAGAINTGSVPAETSRRPSSTVVISESEEEVVFDEETNALLGTFNPPSPSSTHDPPAKDPHPGPTTAQPRNKRQYEPLEILGPEQSQGPPKRGKVGPSQLEGQREEGSQNIPVADLQSSNSASADNSVVEIQLHSPSTSRGKQPDLIDLTRDEDSNEEEEEEGQRDDDDDDEKEGEDGPLQPRAGSKSPTAIDRTCEMSPGRPEDEEDGAPALSPCLTHNSSSSNVEEPDEDDRESPSLLPANVANDPWGLQAVTPSETSREEPHDDSRDISVSLPATAAQDTSLFLPATVATNGSRSSRVVDIQEASREELDGGDQDSPSFLPAILANNPLRSNANPSTGLENFRAMADNPFGSIATRPSEELDDDRYVPSRSPVFAVADDPCCSRELMAPVGPEPAFLNPSPPPEPALLNPFPPPELSISTSTQSPSLRMPISSSPSQEPPPDLPCPSCSKPYCMGKKYAHVDDPGSQSEIDSDTGEGSASAEDQRELPCHRRLRKLLAERLINSLRANPGYEYFNKH